MVGHDNIFRLKSADTDNLDVYMFVISPEFMQDINIDVAVLFQTHQAHPQRRAHTPARRGRKNGSYAHIWR